MKQEKMDALIQMFKENMLAIKRQVDTGKKYYIYPEAVMEIVKETMGILENNLKMLHEGISHKDFHKFLEKATELAKTEISKDMEDSGISIEVGTRFSEEK